MSADTIDPNIIIDTLDPDRIRAALAELNALAKALKVLLRAANARERARLVLGILN